MGSDTIFAAILPGRRPKSCLTPFIIPALLIDRFRQARGGARKLLLSQGKALDVHKPIVRKTRDQGKARQAQAQRPAPSTPSTTRTPV